MNGIAARAAGLLLLLVLPIALLSLRSQPAGQLAYIGADGNVYVVDAARTRTRQITDDATVRIEGSGLSYHRLVWSPSGQLTFASVTRGSNQVSSVLYLSDLANPPITLGDNPEHFVIYSSWSPGSCQQTECTRLAYLIEERESISLREVTIDGSTVHNKNIGQGWPFYFSWNAVDNRMLWHTGGGRLDNSLAQYHHYNLESAQATTLADSPGLLLAPAYAPVGSDWLFVDTQNQLILQQQNKRRVIAQANSSEISFVWSPDGSQVAYAIRALPTDDYLGPVYIYDLASESSQQVTAVGLQPEAFFWAPDSHKIAYLHRMAVRNDIWLQWRLVTLPDLRDQGYDPFIPTPQMRFVVASFNQYAQSHRLWSPDSRYLVYSERGQELDDTIWLIDSWSDSRDPIKVAEGSLAFWSWK